jgi:hypothetical protein
VFEWNSEIHSSGETIESRGVIGEVDHSRRREDERWRVEEMEEVLE